MIEIDRAEYPASTNLLRLLSVRVSLFAATMLAIGLVASVAGLELPSNAIVATLAALAATTLIGWRRAVVASRSVRNVEVLLHIGIDIAALTTLLYFTGGWTNPLVSLYLVPIAAAAVMLPRRLASIVAVATVVCYAVIARFYRPLAFESGAFTLHMAGMWLTFVMAAALIFYLGTTMSTTLRTRALALANARETNLRNEQIIGVATLAAGTAHELSTPLSSIAVIASEMRAHAAADQRRELGLIIEQIELCKGILRRLRDVAAPSDHTHVLGRPIDDFMADIHERFALLRPSVEVEFRCDGEQPSPLIDADPTLRQAVLNLLNNAADASPHAVDCRARWTAREATFDIRDRGTGFDARRAGSRVAIVSNATTPNVDTEGMGMGFMLANATIERLGGTVRVADREGGGTWLQVTLPLAADAR